MPTQASIRVRCPHCQKALSVPPALRGKTVTCPNPACGKSVTLPAPAAPAESVAPVRPLVVIARPVPRAEAGARPQPSSGWRRGLVVAVVAGGAFLLLGGVTLLGAVALWHFSNANPTPQSAARDDVAHQGQQPAVGQDPVAKEAPEAGAAPRAVEATPSDAPRKAPPENPDAPRKAPPENLELPPVGPTKAAAGDRVAQDFKAARAASTEARKKARTDLLAQYPLKREEIQKSNLDAKEKTKLLQDLQTDQMVFAYGPGKSQGTGPLHTHPAMQAAVADYWRAVEAATRKFGEVADKGLAAYAKAGVTDPEKLRPLLAARLASQHTELVGIWGSEGISASYDVWVIDVDETTGGWQVDGTLNYSKGQTGRIHHGENIEFKDGTLSFMAGPVDSKTRKVGSGSTPTTLKLQDGKLHYETRGGPKPIVNVLRRTGEEAARERIEYWGVRKAPPAASGPAAEKPDLNDANYVWRSIAGLSSFPTYRGKSGPAGGEQLYIPYRSKQPTLTPGAYGGLTDMLLGRAPGAGRNQGLAEALFRQYDPLAESPHPYLKRAAGHFLALSRARIQLAEADELFGNTPNSSIREFQQKVFLPAGQYVFQREADRAELEESLRKKHPEMNIVVLDAPMSAESRQKLNELLGGIGGLMEDVQKRSVVSGLLAYADMAQADRAAALWQTWLLPLAKRCGGPASARPLLAVEADWKLNSVQVGRRFDRLNDFRLRNVSGQDLTHAVVEMIAENEWGEKAAHYYYFHQLEVSEVARLVAHPRWEKRRLVFTNTMTVTWSVWADQGSEVGRQVKLTNPTPNPDPAGWRKDYLDFDTKHQAQGEALGAVVRNFRFLPVNPDRQRHRLLEVAAPGTTYVVRLTDQGQPGRPLVVRFLRLNADQAVEAEVFELTNRKPFRPDTPVWKGRLTADQETGYVIRMDSGWTFLIAQDDQPNVAVPASAEVPAREIPLVRVKLP